MRLKCLIKYPFDMKVEELKGKIILHNAVVRVFIKVTGEYVVYLTQTPKYKWVKRKRLCTFKFLEKFTEGKIIGVMDLSKYE